VNLTFDLLGSNLVHIITRQVGNLPPILVFHRTFRSRLIGEHQSDASRDLAALTLEVTALVADTGLRSPSVYQV